VGNAKSRSAMEPEMETQTRVRCAMLLDQDVLTWIDSKIDRFQPTRSEIVRRILYKAMQTETASSKR
jgi:metal-responsive CopG/Arc/MetJ family transcriptional regulator